jgi:hypothetical protein
MIGGVQSIDQFKTMNEVGAVRGAESQVDITAAIHCLEPDSRARIKILAHQDTLSSEIVKH